MMEDFDVEAYFWKEKETILRNRTKIIINGDKDNCIGVVVMLNPGSCLPKEGEKVITNEKQSFPCDIGNDITIKRILECVRLVYNDKKLGYIFIVNLSDIRKPKSEELTEENLHKKPEDIVKEIESKINEQNNIKWIWIAFGKDENGKDRETRLKLKKIKEKVKNQLNIFYPDKIIGKSVEYKHPYQIKEHETYKQKVVKELRDFCTHVKP